MTVVRFFKTASATLIALLFLANYIAGAQEGDKIFFVDFVEVFYADTIEALNIYNKFDGSIVASLDPYSKFCWYKIAIAESRGEWMRIENINVVPCDNEPLSQNQEKYRAQWIKSEQLRVFLTSFGGTLYRTADKNSRTVLRLDKGTLCKLMAVEGNWAKVSLTHKGKLYVGWIEKMHQCALPYTSCNSDLPSDPATPKR